MEEMIIDNSELQGGAVMVEVPQTTKVTKTRAKVINTNTEAPQAVSCLRDETITVKFVPNEKTGLDEKHPYYGSLVDGATITYTVPMLKNGSYKNPLTDNEKAFLEEYLGLEFNALSVHKREDNYWDNFRITLSKVDTILKLSDPIDYIKYKVLLLNKDYVADSYKTLKDRRQETHKFVLVSDKELYSNAVDRTNTKSQCWKEFGKIEDDAEKLICIIKTIDGRNVDPNTPIVFIRSRIDKLIESDPKRFLKEITDPLLSIKVLLDKAVARKVVERRGEFYYYNSEPLCDSNEDPTFTVAANYLGRAENQELKLSIEAKLK